MIDLLVSAVYDGAGTVKVISESLGINYSINSSASESKSYTLYSNDGAKLCVISWSFNRVFENDYGVPSGGIGVLPSVSECNMSVHFNNIEDIAFDINTNLQLNIIDLNVSLDDYISLNNRVLGVFHTTNLGDDSLDLSKYYKFTVTAEGFNVEFFDNDVSQFSHSFDGAIGFDGFIGSSFYAYNNLSTVELETIEFHPIVFDLQNNDGIGNVDYNGISLTLDDTVFDFSTISSFRSLKSFLSTVSDKYQLFFDELGGEPFYVLPQSLVSSVGGTDSSSGSAGTTINTLNIDSILSEIDSQITSSVNTAVSDYFTNNPIDVSDVSISSVVNDVTSALNSFFTDGAYVDLSTTNSTLDNLVSVINSLKTVVNSIDTSNSGTTATVDLSEVFTRFDNVDNAISNIPTTSVDFTDVLSRFDTVDTSLTIIDTKLDNVSTTTVDCSTIDLSSMQTAIVDTISANTHQFITNSSLNGSNGAIYEDGEVLNVEGYTRTYTVVSSQVITTMGNQADYIYLLKDSSDRYMITVQDMLSRPDTV